MEAIFLIGRILFALLLLGSAFGHLTQSEAMGGYAESRGLPNGKLLTQVSGVALLLGGLSMLLGIWGDAGSLGVAILLVIIAGTMHQAFYVIFYSTDGFGYFTITGALFT
jgi:putative oxidoreductase